MTITQRNLLTALLLSFLAATSLPAQVFPAAEHQPRWVMEMWSFAHFIDREEIWAEPETVLLEDTIWTVLTRVQHWNPDSPAAPPGPPDTALIGYYRVDGPRVYFRDVYPPSSSYFRSGLLYDFSLEAGDSVYALAPLSAYGEKVLYHIIDVDTFYCEGQLKRRIRVNFLDQPPGTHGLYHETYWISGIGDIHHPFIPSICLELTCPAMYTTQTFFLGRDTIPVGWDVLPCAVFSSTRSEVRPSSPVVARAQPNPVPRGGLLSLEMIAAPPSGVRRAAIFSSSGQLVHQADWDGQALLSLPTAGWGSGMFWAIIVDREGRRHRPVPFVVME
jgi:hypothetical protein